MTKTKVDYEKIYTFLRETKENPDLGDIVKAADIARGIGVERIYGATMSKLERDGYLYRLYPKSLYAITRWWEEKEGIINERNVEMFERFFASTIDCDDYYAWEDAYLSEYTKLVVEVVGRKARNNESKYMGEFFKSLMIYMLEEEQFTGFIENLARLYHNYLVS